MDPDAPREDRVADSNYPGWGFPGRWRPIRVVRAEGSTFWDDRGRAYLDFASQLVASNLGHGNAAVRDAILRQAGELDYVAPGFSTPARERLSEALDGVLPKGLRRYFFSTSGTEANEAALKIARLATGRRQVVARTRSYHGATAGALSVTGEFRREAAGGVGEVPGTLFAPDCYCYRCPLGLSYPSCDVACAEEVERTIVEGGDVAAVILEPIVGTNGVILPVAEYLPRVREITRRHGALLIADEVMTGWGRTGRWFGGDHWGLEPDVLTTAKGLTGAAVPLGLTATTPEVYDRFRGRFFPHGHTYEAHPLALAPAAAAIGEYRRLGLVEKSRRDGELLVGRLRDIAARHPSVGEVRGLGLFAAVELVRDRERRIPMNTPEEKRAGRPLVAEAVARAMMDRGVYAIAWVSHLLLAPPLIVTPEELDRGLHALDESLVVADAELSRPGPVAPG